VLLGKPENGAAAIRRAGKGAVALRAAVETDAKRHAQNLETRWRSFGAGRVPDGGVARR
jgi:hypothetical protein